MKAMVFAAGRGTRLGPFTENCPKALVEIDDHTLLEIALRRLKLFGVREVVVNVHYLADQIETFLRQHRNFGLTIHLSDERELLLDTGGGLLRAAGHFRDAPFLIHNVDIVSDLNLDELYREALYRQAIATIAVRRRNTSRYLLFDADGQLCGWRNDRTGEEKRSRPAESPTPLAYSGICVLSPRIFDYMPADQPVFSLIDVLLNAGGTQPVTAYDHTEGRWFDVGKPRVLEPAGQFVRSLPLG